MATVLAEAIGGAAGAVVCWRVAWAAVHRKSPEQRRRAKESWEKRHRQWATWSREFRSDYRARKLLTTPPETWVKEAEAKFDADREYRARMSRRKRR